MHKYYDSEEEKGNGQSASDLIINNCAEALKSEKVEEALKLYNLSEDFELYIVHPDDPKQQNYCNKIL
jgi:hypothetical protein